MDAATESEFASAPVPEPKPAVGVIATTRTAAYIFAASAFIWAIPVVASPFITIPAVRFIQGTGPNSVKPLAWHVPNFKQIGLPVDLTYPPLTANNRVAAESFAASLLPEGKRWPDKAPAFWRTIEGLTQADAVSGEDARAMVSTCQSVEVLPMGTHEGAPDKQDALATYRCLQDGPMPYVQAGLVLNDGHVEEVFIGPQPKVVFDLAGKVPEK